MRPSWLWATPVPWELTAEAGRDPFLLVDFEGCLAHEFMHVTDVILICDIKRPLV